MSVNLDALTFRGHVYGSVQAANAARAAADAAEQRAHAAAEQRREDFERRLRNNYLSGGGTPEQWEREKSDILRAARAQAALAGDDAARSADRQRYG
jgi:hypothetical protein